MRKLLLLIFTIISLATMSQVRVVAPSQVVVGEEFRLQYVVEGTDYQGMRLGSTPNFDVLAGPSVSTFSSYQNYGGRTTHTSTVTLTYILMAREAGTHTIGAATINVGGETITTDQARIQVLPPDSRSSGQQGGYNPHKGGARGNKQGGQMGNQGGMPPKGQGRRTQTARRQPRASDIAPDELFVTVTANRRHVYEQEAILLTYKLYTLVGVSAMSGELPQLHGCHIQEINQTQERSLQLEHYNGMNYRTCVWSQYLVFPQQTGTITIPAVNFEAVANIQVASADPFDAFFSGGSMLREVRKTITAPALTLTVDSLPSPRPANFSGAVGQFTMTTTLSPDSLRSNEALTLQVVINGRGNMRLIQAPTVTFPTDFETYDARITDNLRTGTQGVSGSRTYDYIAVPRYGGNYDLPPVTFCYFDPTAREYKTLTSEAYNINVERAEGETRPDNQTLHREELEMLSQDIRFIKRGPINVASTDGTLISSPAYWLSYLALATLLAVALIVTRHRQAANADVMGSRRRKAGKRVSRRLRTAHRMMQAANQDAFYDELLKALWGFAADKLSINVSQLGRDNVAQRMAQNGVSQNSIDQFIAILDECEFARYAPGDPAANMDKVYKQAEQVISQI